MKVGRLGQVDAAVLRVVDDLVWCTSVEIAEALNHAIERRALAGVLTGLKKYGCVASKTREPRSPMEYSAQFWRITSKGRMALELWEAASHFNGMTVSVLGDEPVQEVAHG